MAHNPIFRKVTITENYSPLSDTSLRGKFTIVASMSNLGMVEVKGEDGGDLPVFSPNTHFDFLDIDLRDIQVKGTAGDVLMIAGESW